MATPGSILTGEDILGYKDDDEDSENEEGPSFAEHQMRWQTEKAQLEGASRARTKETQDAYDRSVQRLEEWMLKHTEQPSVIAVMTEDPETKRYHLDAAKLAKSLEESANVYTNYTLTYQLAMNEIQKSGLGHIKTLRSGLSDFFCKNGVELSKLALDKLTLWQKSRRRDDMAAKMKDIDPVKFSNARSSLPFNAYEKITHLMALEHDPLLHVMFVLQWNCIARVSNIQSISFNHMEWIDDHLSTRWSKSKKDQEG